MISAGFIDYKMAHQITPIILTGGIAAGLGDGLPIVALTNPGDDSDPVTSQNISPSLDGYAFNYQPLAGGTLIDNNAATYPMANQAIAANAIIVNPNAVSMLMHCPAKSDLTFSQRRTLITSLQASLTQHINMGGQFTVVTPAFIFVDGILLKWRDVSQGEGGGQYQYAWQLDFFFPLTSLAAATQAYNGLTQKLADGTPPSGSTGWPAGSSVQNPTDATTQSLVPDYTSPTFTAPSPLAQ